jgi:hypothetical protein
MKKNEKSHKKTRENGKNKRERGRRKAFPPLPERQHKAVARPH